MSARRDTPEIILSFSSMAWYRLEVMRQVVDHFGERVVLYAGDRALDPAIRVLGPGDIPCVSLRNILLPRQIVLQRVPLGRYLRSKVLVLDLNPRLLHNWLILVLRRLCRRQTVVWGHLWPRAGQRAKSAFLRGIQRRLANGMITYTHSEAQELRRREPHVRVDAAPNALYKAERFKFDGDQERHAFIYVGRLDSAKKPGVLITAFEAVHRKYPWTKLIVIGDGKLRAEIANQVASSPVQRAIELRGQVEDYERLRTAYACAIASVSPGYVGLSVTQSLSFGVPMIVSRTEPHAPEIEAVDEGVNSAFFETDDVDDLARCMSQMVEARSFWASRGPGIARSASEQYSTERMSAGIIRAIERSQP